MINLSQFDYKLNPDLIANQPVSTRDHSQLMFINRKGGQISHHRFYNLPQLLNSNFILVLNQTKVFPARIFAQKKSGGHVEILLTSQLNSNTWETISKPRLKLNQTINFASNLFAQVIFEDKQQGYSHLQFSLSDQHLIKAIHQIGLTPIPPYIKSTYHEKKLRQQYQTVYAHIPGSCAAPTAGLHFTRRLLNKLEEQGIAIKFITLHVGPGTFQNLRPENLKTKSLHTENYQIDKKTATFLNQAKADAKKIIAVGTTTARTLESSLSQDYQLVAQKSSTNLFIFPPYRFKFIDGLITNFHLPQSSLLMLVSAFSSSPQTHSEFKTFKSSLIGKAYQQAIKNHYRFYSFGDAMLIL